MSRSPRAILAEAAETDRREEELYGEARGDELPEQLGTSEGRAALREAKRRLDAEREAQGGDGETSGDGPLVALDPERELHRFFEGEAVPSRGSRQSLARHASG